MQQYLRVWERTRQQYGVGADTAEGGRPKSEASPNERGLSSRILDFGFLTVLLTLRRGFKETLAGKNVMSMLRSGFWRFRVWGPEIADSQSAMANPRGGA